MGVHEINDIGKCNDIEVKHSQYLVEDLCVLLKNKDYSDVSFKIGSTKIKAHKMILASRSSYFKALFYGGLKESQENEIALDSETPIDAFETILSYIYTGEVSLCNKNINQLQDMISLADKYGFVKLMDDIAEYIKKSLITTDNVIEIYRIADIYRLSTLKEACHSVIEKNAITWLESGAYQELSSKEFKDIFSNDSFFLDEIVILAVAKEWISFHPDSTSEEQENVTGAVRLHLISRIQLIKKIWPLNLFKPNDILKAMESQHDSQNLNQRKIKCIFDQNVALKELGARVVSGYDHYTYEGHNLLTYDVTEPYDEDVGYYEEAWHASNGITISLGSRYWINSIRFLFWDTDSRKYSYTIDVSKDYIQWNRVIDRSDGKKYGSWQDLSFGKMDLQYIRVNGCSNSTKSHLRLIYLEARLKTE